MEDFPNKHSTQATSTVSATERLLSKLGHGYKRAKAQQILRLLKDQESLNKRFKDCALNDDDDDDVDDTAPTAEEALGFEISSGECVAGVPETTKHSVEEQNAGTRKVFQNIDPSRCRTSMGFYNEAECSEVVDGDKEEIIDFEAETDAALMEERQALLGPLASNSRHTNQGQRRLFRLQLDENEPISEEAVVQSARSSRPKTGIASSSIKSKQYRRPMQQTTDNNINSGSIRHRGNATTKNTTISTSVCKLEGPMTTPRGNVRAFCDNPSMPKDEYGCLVSTPRNNSFQPLTPRYNDLNGSFTPRKEDQQSYPCATPRTTDPNLSNRLQHDLALCLTPRNNETSVALTPRQNDWNCLHTPRHNELSLTSPRPKNPQRSIHKLFNQFAPREETSPIITSPRMDDTTAAITPRTQTRKYGALKPVKDKSVSHQGVKRVTIVDKTNDSAAKALSSNYNGTMADRGLSMGVRMPTTPRSIITVDQSPLQTMQGVSENGEVLTPRRQNKSESNNHKSKNLSTLQRSGVHHNLSKLSERVHPITMMKLPPLEVTMNKPVIS